MGFLEGAAGGAVVGFVIKAYDEYSQELDKAQQHIGNLGKEMLAIGAGMTAVGAGLGYALSSAAQSAAVAGDVQDTFNRLVGEDGVDALNKFTAATLGTISKTEAMAAINSLVIKGIDQNNIPTMAKYAQQLKDSGQAQGSVTDIINQMSNALVSGRYAMLARMGVTINEKDILESYAMAQVEAQAAEKGSVVSKQTLVQHSKLLIESLSETEKKSILQAAALDQIRKASEKLPEPTSDYADRLAEVAANMQNLKEQIGKAVLPAFEFLINKTMILINWFTGLSDSTKKLIAISALVVSALLVVGGALVMLAGAFLILTAATGAFTAVNIWWIGIILLALAAIVAIIAIIVKWKDMTVEMRLRILSLLGPIGAIIAMIMYWREILLWLVKTLLNVVVALMNIWDKFKTYWKVAQEYVFNILKMAWNGILDYISMSINAYINMINKIINAMNRVPGVRIPLIPEVSLDKFKAELTDLGKLQQNLELENAANAATRQAALDLIMQNVSEKLKPKATEESLSSPLQSVNTKPSTEVNINIEKLQSSDPADAASMVQDLLRNKIQT